MKKSNNKTVMVSIETYDALTEIKQFFEELFKCSADFDAVIKALIRSKVDLSIEMDLVKPLNTLKV